MVSWQNAQIKKLGIEVRYNATLTEDVLKEHPDKIVVAIGGTPFIPPVKGLETYKLASDVLLGKVDVGKNVLIIGGGLVGAETAEYLGYHGINVTLVEMLPQIAKDGESAPNGFLFDNLEKYGVKIFASTSVERVFDRQANLKTPEGEQKLDNIDDVIIATGFRPSNDLDVILQSFEGEVVRIGDANKVKNGLYNLREAYEVALKL